MRNKILFLIILTFTIAGYSQTEKITVHLQKNIFLILEKSEFEVTDEKFDFYESYPPGDLIAIGINGKIIFGTDDGRFPKSKLMKAELKVGDKIYNLNVDGMYNPWFEDEINKNRFRLRIDHNGIIKLSGIFSDGAGSYGAEWIIFKDSNTRTILSKDEEIIIGYF